MTLEQYKKIQHVDEIVKVADDSWWVYRRSIGKNGFLSVQSRVVFFAQTKAEVEQWQAQA